MVVLGIGALLASERVRDFAAGHGVLIYVMALALLLSAGIAIDRMLSMRTQRDEAIARYPRITRRDQELFDRIEREMGRGASATAYLGAVFDGKSWQWTPMQPYLSFADDWGGISMFDDPVMEVELRKFHSVASDFYGDAAVESAHPDDCDPHDRYAVLNSGAHRPQYGDEWTRVRERLIQKAQAMVAASDALYVLGRQRGY